VNNVNDTGFLSAMIDRLIAERAVDPKLVFATGISNGGMMSYRLGCELAEKIAGIAPVAGALNAEPCQPAAPVSVIAIHGKADGHVRFEGGAPYTRADLFPRVDKSFAYARDFWVKQDACSGAPRVETNGRATSQTWSDCRNGTAVAFYSIEGEGHTWPGGQMGYAGADRPGQDFSATETIWTFFKAHPKR
jgi:polyhydroxybutyrate depolymerase